MINIDKLNVGALVFFPRLGENSISDGVIGISEIRFLKKEKINNSNEKWFQYTISIKI